MKWQPSVINEGSQSFQDLGRRLHPAVEVTWKAKPVMEDLLLSSSASGAVD